MDKVKTFWETCAYKYAHIIAHDVTEGGIIEKVYKEYFIDHIDWTDKTVIDYGCGGGWVGKYLFEQCKIKIYYGIDIAQRSLDAAAKTLAGNPAEFYLTPVDLKTIKSDILFCIACIQHFPDEEHFNDFMKNVNDSGIKTVILQIRKGEKTVFNDAYNTGLLYGFACLTNKFDVGTLLTNYRLTKANTYDILNYEYLIFEKI